MGAHTFDNKCTNVYMLCRGLVWCNIFALLVICMHAAAVIIKTVLMLTPGLLSIFLWLKSLFHGDSVTLLLQSALIKSASGSGADYWFLFSPIAFFFFQKLSVGQHHTTAGQTRSQMTSRSFLISACLSLMTSQRPWLSLFQENSWRFQGLVTAPGTAGTCIYSSCLLFLCSTHETIKCISFFLCPVADVFVQLWLKPMLWLLATK